MPFTLSHPAAILPLARRPLVASALVMGSMAPDVPYFLPSGRWTTWRFGSQVIEFNGSSTHSFLPGEVFGMTGIWLSSGIGLVLLALFQLLLKWPLISLLPRSAVARLHEPAVGFRWAGWRNVLWIVVSVVIGVLTHLVWDSFTHGDGFMVEHASFLRADLFGTITLHRLLQYLSSLLGAAVLLWWGWRWWKVTPPVPVPGSVVILPRATSLLMLTGLAGGAFVGVLWEAIWLHSQNIRDLRSWSYSAAVGASSGFAAAVLVFCLGWWVVGRQRIAAG